MRRLVVVTLSASPDFEAQSQYSFTVIATDNAGNKSEQPVTLDINNLDEIAPTITSGDSAGAIDENSGAGSVIYTATADDSLDTSAGVTFALTGDSDSALSINASTGEVTLASNADHESQTSYSFTVVASDGVNEAVEQSVTLDVNNLDEVAPSITSGATATAIDENSGAGQVVYTATATDGADTSDGFLFSLADDSLGFSIDADTGEVTTNTDFAANYEDALSQNFTVVATDVAGNASQQVVTVAVNNLDEIAPTITSGDSAGAIDENSGAGSVIYTAIADDSLDTSAGVTFSLSDDSDDALSIDASTGAVTLSSDADYEGQTSYSFTVVASDGVNADVEQSVTLDVNNLDEVAPSITSGATATAIDENSGADQIIYTATAEDIADISGGFTFSLAEGSDAALSIDASTGAVTLATDPDHETQAQYSFAVIATDAAGNISQAKAVTLDINNLDEVAPTITSADTAVTLNENSGAEQVIYTATADDSADVADTPIAYSLAEGSDAALSINAETGAVTLTTDPDHETQSQYSFSVIATDAAGNASEAQSVTLDINDLDDAAPTVTSGATAVAIDENSGAGQVIYTATADDSADISAGVTFSLTEGSDAGLSIDASTGAVTLTTDPDHEAQSQYSFAVIATDAAGNASEAQSVTLDINDLDDAAPTVTSGATAVAIDENSGAGQVIYTATADDSADISAGVTFSLTEGSDAGLSIDASTGAVTLTTDPDHEIQSQYSFSVIATDAAGNASAEQAVTLDINDLDDTAPTITSAVTAEAIDENSGAGQVVYTASADDSADVADTPIAYSLAEGSDAALSIDASTGAVTLATDPDHETQAQYSFAVIATDAAGNASAAQSVTLDINDLDEVAPTVTSGDTAATIDENSGASQVIYTATADDSADISDGYTFSLVDNTEYPSESETSIPELAAATQHVYVSSSTKSEDGTQETLVISYNADDATTTGLGIRIHFDSTKLSVASLENVFSSDNIFANAEPSADTDNYDGDSSTDSYVDLAWASLFGNWPGENSIDLATITLDIAEGASGSSAINFTASSNASGFAFDGQNHGVAISAESQLTINPSSGAVTLATDPDHEIQAQYSFSVIATDAAGNASEAQSVTLDINDLDEVAPTVTSGDTAATIDENSGASQVIYTATADDSADISAGVTFSLTEGSDAALSIDASTGAVTLATDPDHETVSQYTFDVIATDAAGNISAPKTVTLDINNLDDTAPTITSSGVAIDQNDILDSNGDLVEPVPGDLDENSGAGQVIYTATADDSLDISAGVTFSLIAEEGQSIDGLTISDVVDDEGNVIGADVVLTVDPDYETKSEYSFSVVATDAAGYVSEPQPVTLDINNLDEVSPAFTSDDQASVVDGSESGQIVYIASTDDTGDISDGVTYSFAGDLHDPALTINAETGEVTLNESPNYVTKPEYIFSIVADDDVPDNLKVIKQVTLNVSNVDNTAPTIESAATAAVDENSGANQIVYTAIADDSQDVSDGYTFSLAYAAPTVEAGVSSYQSVYISESQVEDNGEDSSTLNVKVAYQSDIEEGLGLRIHFDSDALSFASISSELASYDDTAPIIAVADTEADENSVTDSYIDLNWSALAGPEGDASSVTEILADLSFDIEAGFDSDTVISFSAIGANEVVSFESSESSVGTLQIDSASGAVTLADDPDNETVSQYTFDVIATDAAGNISAPKTVTLDINNLDEIAPQITSDVVADDQNDILDIDGNVVEDIPGDLDENSGAGQVIYTATADDSADISDGVRFSLSSDSDDALSINSITGDVTLTTNPDHETKSEYSFSVVATDAAGNPSEAEAVTLDINDLDDALPEFISGVIATPIDENSGAEQVIYTANADDSQDISAGVSFSLSEGSDTGLTIDSSSGEVTLADNPVFTDQSSYSFTVVASDGVNPDVEQSVILNINNLDEADPTITSDASDAIAVNENSGAGQVVYTASALDTDFNGAEDITYSLADETLGFSIDADTGVVTTNADFSADFESAESQSFTIVATDTAGNSSEQVVTVAVNNLDEVAPTITSVDSAGSINENSGAGSVIYTATADDSLDTGAGVSFSLSDDSDAALSIDASTGAVTLASDANYEDQTSYSFTVVASDGVNTDAEQSVTLNVNDLDEVAPTITSDDSAGSIDENSGAGSVIYTAIADDSLDTSAGVTFSLSDDSDDALSIDASTGEVTLASDADYEGQTSYSFTVVASDGVNEAVEQSVTLDVNNLDEVAPTITSDASDAIVVNENSGAGQVVYTAVATDTDANIEGISFSLADVSLGFSIDADTGEVTTNTDFAANYEDAQSQSFTVVASDVAGNSTEQVVTVAVNNLDEIAPSIDSGDTGAAVNENSGAGQVVYTATAADGADTSDGFSFSLADNNLGFSIDAVSGEVTTNADFSADFESAESQSFTVVATDVAGNASQQTVSVAVNNFDEVAPTITSGDLADSIDENSGAGSVIYTATADDSLDTSAGVTFSLSDDSDAALSIDASTGAVTLASDADYETQPVYTFTVIASDGINDNVEQSVTLDVNNLDEVAPTFDSSGNVSVLTSKFETGVVYQAIANDDGDISGGIVQFSLTGEDASLFNIDSSGQVTAIESDAVLKEHYSFSVIATDAAGIESLPYPVVLTIVPEDTAPPEITSSDSATIDENIGSSQIIYVATSQDESEVSYSLADGADAGLAINQITGEVTLADNPDYDSDSEGEVKQSYSFTVVASDEAGNSVELPVTVTVNNLDEVAPTITSADSATIDENSGASQVIYTATAADTDFNGAEDITYSLSNDSDAALSIDALTGAVTLTTNPDYETQSQYSFSVLATDAAGNVSEPKPVTLDINNLDDTAAVISSGDTGTTVDENSDVGQVVYTTTATDANIDGIVFSLADDALGFSIDAESGVVTTNEDFAADYEDAQSQSFTVVATDEAGNASQQTVSVAVNNFDEVAPTITSGDLADSIDENSGAGSVIYTATADDSLDTSAGVTFSLSDDSDDALSIDASTGAVTLVTDPDFEGQVSYSFTVVASDGVNADVEKSVTLDVNNLDEIAPTITSDASATIDENVSAGLVIYTAVADDSLDTSAGVTFSLAAGSDVELSIDASTGEVTLASDTDYETKFSYSFIVVASDGVNADVKQPVTLTVNNLDEVAPSIDSGDTGAAVDENSGAGQVVYTATATDGADTSDGFSFSLADDSLGFSIDADTGEVTTNADFAANYEDALSQSFTVVATDAAGNASDQVVTIAVNNLDEVSATITSGDSAGSIDENSGAGSVIYTATADDSLDTSAGVTFSLSDDSDAALSIDASTGAVTLASDADYEGQTSYSFTVVASDGVTTDVGQPVTLTVNNLDDTAPAITSGDSPESTILTLDENSGAGQLIYTAEADDSSDISNGVVQFSLAVGSDSSLSINRWNGQVRLSSDPDYEIQEKYVFTVIATDEDGNNSEQEVTLNINNIDEVAPIIVSSEQATVSEVYSAEGSQTYEGFDGVVYTASADDSADISGGVTYQIANQNVGNDSSATLSINEDGEVLLNTGELSYYNQSTYTFDITATDVAGNVSEAQTVTLTVLEAEPEPAVLLDSLGIPFEDGTYTQNSEISVSNLKLGAKWEYSTDGGNKWLPGAESAASTEGLIQIDADGDYQVDVRVTNAQGESTSLASPVSISVDNLPPVAQFVSADKDNQQITVEYSESLNPSHLPQKYVDSDNLGDYEITQNGVDLYVTDVAISQLDSNILILTIDKPFSAGALNFSYTASDNTDNLVTDLAGNALDQNFEQMIVSDGYIRGAQVYVDTNGDGIAQDSFEDKQGNLILDDEGNPVTELRSEVTSDAFGQIILTEDFWADERNYKILEDDDGNVIMDEFGEPSIEKYSIIIKGGVNMDSGAPNEIELSAPGGYAVINPLSTLVQEVVSSGLSLDDAESTITTSLGITGSGDLSTYDPQSDDNVANRVIATQIATVLAVASSTETTGSENAETLALANLASTISSAEGTVTLDSSTMDEVLEGVIDGDSTERAALDLAVDAMETAKSLDPEAAFKAIVEAQAQAIDTVAPQAPEPALAPESNSGVSDTDALTSDASPIVRFYLDTTALDGSAVVAGDTLEIFNNNLSLGTSEIEAVHIENGYYDYKWVGDLPDASYFISATLEDLATNESEYVITYKFMIDTVPLEIALSDTADPINENSDAQIIYTATVDGDDLWKFEFSEDSDAALSINANTGEVTLNVSPDYETQSEYSFSVIATDAAGNVSEPQPVTLGINNLDEVAPTIDSGDTGTAVNENSGAGQVVYEANATDTDANVEGVTFSLADDTLGFSIDAESGVVTTNADFAANYEDAQSQSLTVVATDVAGNSSEQVVTVDVNNLDEVAPTITSGDSAGAIDENSGAGSVIYTATADDTLDASGGVTFSLSDVSDAALSIDASTGAVTLASNADYETNQSISFTVVASDGVNADVEQSVTLDVNNLDEVAPSITLGATATAIDENSGAGQVVYTATATDGADTSDGFSFSLADDSLGFSIDADTGEVTTNADFAADYEAENGVSQSFTVVATDAAGNASDQVVTVEVNNLDEIAPTITSVASATIDENVSAGSVIYTANDDDSLDVSAGVTFTLAAGSDAGLIIDASTGDVTLASDTDYETKFSYSFIVVASDGVNPDVKQPVTLNINNLDEVAPTITSGDSAGAIDENSGAGSVIYTAIADDSLDTSAGVTFALTGDSDSALSINASTGEVTLDSDADYEDQTSYSFTCSGF
jgi:hypothetical protein